MRFGIKFLLAPERSIRKPAALCLCKEPSGPWRCPADRFDVEFGGFAAAAGQGGSAGLRTALRGCLCLHWDTCAGTCWEQGLKHSQFQGHLWIAELPLSSSFCGDWELRPPGFGPIPLKVLAQIWILKQHFADIPLMLSCVFLGTTCLDAVGRAQIEHPPGQKYKLVCTGAALVLSQSQGHLALGEVVGNGGMGRAPGWRWLLGWMWQPVTLPWHKGRDNAQLDQIPRIWANPWLTFPGAPRTMWGWEHPGTPPGQHPWGSSWMSERDKKREMKPSGPTTGSTRGRGHHPLRQGVLLGRVMPSQGHKGHFHSPGHNLSSSSDKVLEFCSPGLEALCVFGRASSALPAQMLRAAQMLLQGLFCLLLLWTPVWEKLFQIVPCCSNKCRLLPR